MNAKQCERLRQHVVRGVVLTEDDELASITYRRRMAGQCARVVVPRSFCRGIASTDDVIAISIMQAQCCTLIGSHRFVPLDSDQVLNQKLDT